MPDTPIANAIPPASEVANRIGFLLRELQLAKQLLRVAKIADQSRRLNAEAITANPTATSTEAAHASR